MFCIRSRVPNAQLCTACPAIIGFIRLEGSRVERGSNAGLINNEIKIITVLKLILESSIDLDSNSSKNMPSRW